jgi:hypothetical protein
LISLPTVEQSIATVQAGSLRTTFRTPLLVLRFWSLLRPQYAQTALHFAPLA